MITAQIPASPPRYWVAAKQRLGISVPGLGRIWHHTYTDQRRLAAWMAAPDGEWHEHGMCRAWLTGGACER